MDADMSGVDKQSMALQLLLDERDIIALAARYCRALDTKDWSQLDEVFLPIADRLFVHAALQKSGQRNLHCLRAPEVRVADVREHF